MESHPVVRAVLGDLLVEEPMGEGPLFQVPLVWQGAHESPPTLGFTEAYRQGWLEEGLASLWTNRGPHVVLASPGEPVGLSGMVVDQPALFPPGCEARLGVRPRRQAYRPAPPVATGPRQCGSALFVGPHLHLAVVMPGPGALSSYLGHQDLGPENLVDPEAHDGPMIWRTRRIFAECWYAEMQALWRAGPFSIVRIRAPRARGWAALCGSALLAMDLRPRLIRAAAATATV